MNLTVLIGELYKKEPEWVKNKADSHNLGLARQEADEVDDYNQQLENDPVDCKEMLEAADQYAKENDIDESNDVLNQASSYPDISIPNPNKLERNKVENIFKGVMEIIEESEDDS